MFLHRLSVKSKYLCILQCQREQEQNPEVPTCTFTECIKLECPCCQVFLKYIEYKYNSTFEILQWFCISYRNGESQCLKQLNVKPVKSNV